MATDDPDLYKGLAAAGTQQFYSPHREGYPSPPPRALYNPVSTPRRRRVTLGTNSSVRGMDMSGELILYSYWRSSAAYRVRIALNLKQLPYALRTVSLVQNGGEQHSAAYRRLNPQGLVPVLLDGERVFRQSLAIIEYLEDAYDGELQLLPSLARDRARVRALAQMIACDIHPLGNQRVLQYLDREFSTPEVERQRWMLHWIKIGFDALEPLLHDHPAVGLFCEADVPGLADCCLVPQVYNAYRWGLDMQAYPIIRRIHAACMELQAFQHAVPEAQPDAPQQN